MNKAKAKGNRLEHLIVDSLRCASGLEHGDFRKPFGRETGEDVKFSPEADRKFNCLGRKIKIECKYRSNGIAALRFMDQAIEHTNKDLINNEPIVILKEPRKQPYAIISWETLVELLKKVNEK